MIKFWISSTFKDQAEKKELLRESEEKWQRAGRQTRRDVNDTKKKERALMEEWSIGSTTAEKFTKMRPGHMVISGLGGFNQICFSGVIWSDWNGFRSE